MDNLEIKIVTESAVNLQDKDWINIEKLILEFPINSKSTHNNNEFRNKEYFKNKLLNSPSGSCYVTRAIDKFGNFLGLQTLTRKNFFNSGKKTTSFELGDVYVHPKLQGKSIYFRILKDSILFLEKNFKFAFVYATANQLSQPWLIRGGFKLIDYQLNFNILPIRPYLIFKIKFFKKLFLFINPIYIFLIRIYLYALSINMPFQFNLINDFKGFPEEHKPNHDIELDRSYDYLQWRYIENPHSYEIYKINLKNDYIGYAIFRKAKYQVF